MVVFKFDHAILAMMLTMLAILILTVRDIEFYFGSTFFLQTVPISLMVLLRLASSQLKMAVCVHYHRLT